MGRVESEVLPSLVKCGCELRVRGYGAVRAVSILKVCGNHETENGEGHQVTENSSAKASEYGGSYVTPAVTVTHVSHTVLCTPSHTYQVMLCVLGLYTK